MSGIVYAVILHLNGNEGMRGWIGNSLGLQLLQRNLCQRKYLMLFLSINWVDYRPLRDFSPSAPETTAAAV